MDKNVLANVLATLREGFSKVKSKSKCIFGRFVIEAGEAASQIKSSITELLNKVR